MTHEYDQPLCAMCDKTSKQLCAGCHSIKYCSRVCQKHDWPVHKLVCKSFSGFVASRPSPEHRAAIYFPLQETDPTFVWLRYSTVRDESLTDTVVSQFTSLGVPKEQLHRAVHEEINGNPALGRHIVDRHLLLSTLNSTTYFGDPWTQSLTKVDKELGKFFRGSIVVWAGNRVDSNPVENNSNDLGPMDFRHAVDYLRYLYDRTFEDACQFIAQRTGGIHGVRLNCQGDQDCLERPALEAVLEPSTTFSMASEMITPIADAVCLPLIIRKVQPSLVWRGHHDKGHPRCLSASLLSLPDRKYLTGSLVVSRKDGNPLHPEHLHALFGYAGFTLCGAPSSTGDDGILAHKLQSEHTTRLSKEGFKSWFAKEWKTLYREDTAPSPYDLEALKGFAGSPLSISAVYEPDGNLNSYSIHHA